MGQYYKPCSLEKMEYVYSHDYDNGLKLMEHSYIGNNFVAAVESLISKGGKWYGDRIVWAGDYADNEAPIGNGLNHGEYGETERFENTEGENLYSLVGENKLKPVVPEHVRGTYRKKRNFLKNLDTGEWVDLRKVPVTSESDWVDRKTGKKYHYKMRIHPLPLLTCEGNGRGGGDYHKSHPLVGKWARNRVVMQKERPRKGKEIIFDLVE
jgi:hypothetical protein